MAGFAWWSRDGIDLRTTPSEADLRIFWAYTAAGSAKAAAHQLGMTEGGVRNGLLRLRSRLGVETNLQAMRALRNVLDNDSDV